jgi:hypothetical protein
MPPNQASQKRYPPELKERTVRMVLETIEENGGDLCILAPGLTAHPCRVLRPRPGPPMVAYPSYNARRSLAPGRLGHEPQLPVMSRAPGARRR